MSDIEKNQNQEEILNEEEKAPQEEEKLSLEEQLEKIQEEKQELKDQAEAMKDEALRAKAEVENIRKRSERDVQNARKFGIERFAKELLPVIDSIDQALKHEVKSEESIAMKDGIELTSKMFVDILKKNGLEELDPKGDKFDPNIHEAIAMVPNPEAESDTIFDVFQKGYSLNGRVVRAAKVVVVKN